MNTIYEDVKYHLCYIEESNIYIALKGTKEAIGQYEQYCTNTEILKISDLVAQCKYRNIETCAITVNITTLFNTYIKSAIKKRG